MNRNVFNIFCALLLTVSAYSVAGGLSKSLRPLIGLDTVCNVWVRFGERSTRGGVLPLADGALERRRRSGFGGEDRAINPAYVDDIVRRGGRLRHEFHWENAASFSVHSSRLLELASLPYVKSVTPVAVYVRRGADGSGFRKPVAPLSRADDVGYRWHGEMVNMRLAHDYIKAKRLGDPGAGVIAAFFDTGFRLGHRAFNSGRDSSAFLISARDFVDNDMTVFDPDSVNYDVRHPYFQNDKHGTQCLGIVAGYDPGRYVGAAWGARFLLARTEDYAVEARIEEDNWAAAVVWAEAQGAQIISSSLGYRDEFDDPSDDYDYADMDGKTTVVARAAAGAVKRGVIVVNSVGNEWHDVMGTLIAPADVDGVVAVGAVDASGRLARFSSSGPTADGRFKPEVVAPGVSVPLVDPYSYDAYTTGNGTSFAAPVISGIFALILQAHPGIAAEQARDRLYKSCVPAAGQSGLLDNLHGYGIPNALHAVMNDDEIFVKVADRSGNPVPGVTVTAATDVSFTNEFGSVFMTARKSAIPFDLRIAYRGEHLQTLYVDALPFASDITIDVDVDDGSRVMPNVVMRKRAVTGRCYFPPSGVWGTALAMIRTVDGRTVWRQRLKVGPDGMAEFAWKRGNGKPAAGVYFLTVRRGKDIVNQRIVLAN